MSKSLLKVVCDAGPIIHLDEIDSLYLLEDFREILISPAVRNEVQKKRPALFAESGLPFVEPPIALPGDKTLATMCRVFSLDAGEVEALALMEREPETLFLTDDSAARLVAERMGYRVHGTIGILVRSIRQKQLEAKEVLELLESISLDYRPQRTANSRCRFWR